MFTTATTRKLVTLPNSSLIGAESSRPLWAGGFVGVGERDVAVPYSQINWVYQPVASSCAGTAPITTTGAKKSASQSPENARFNPDHAVLNMTKDELKAAPAFTFSR
jgi:hypothetical protein